MLSFLVTRIPLVIEGMGESFISTLLILPVPERRHVPVFHVPFPIGNVAVFLAKFLPPISILSIASVTSVFFALSSISSLFFLIVVSASLTCAVRAVRFLVAVSAVLLA